MNCAGRHTPDDPATASEPGPLCERCVSHLRSDILELAKAEPWLRQCMVRYPQWDTNRVAGTREPPAPLKVSLLDHAMAIDDLIRRVHRTIAPNVRPRAVPSTLATAEMIVKAMNSLRRHPEVMEMWRQVRDAKQQAHTLAPWRRPFIRLPVPCQECGLLTLALFSGDSWVTCRNDECAEIAIPYYRYDKWLKTLLQQHGLPAGEPREMAAK